MELTLIPIYVGGAVAHYSEVDAADAHFGEHTWGLSAGYAYRYETVAGRRVHRYLHREIIGLKSGDGLEADHVNRDKLDNRRSNLRVATRAENAQNLAASRHGRVRGVNWHAPRGKWRARAMLDGREHHLGLFVDKLDAVAAVTRWRAEHMPFSVEA